MKTLLLGSLLLLAAYVAVQGSAHVRANAQRTEPVVEMREWCMR